MRQSPRANVLTPGMWIWSRFSLGRLLRSPYLLLFLTLMFAYAYTPPRWQDWNQNSRIDLTMAIVDQHTVRIDSYAANTGDYATVGSHTYSDKAPGLSLLAVPVYAAVKTAEPLGLGKLMSRASSGKAVAATLNPEGRGFDDARLRFELALYLATLTCVSIPGAITGVLVALSVERLTGCRTSGIASGLIMGLATPLFTYSQAFYGHVPAAACVTGAAAIMILSERSTAERSKYVLVGALLGLAVVIEYPAAVVGIPIALWALARGRSKAAVFGVLGSIIPFTALVIYDYAAFRTLLPVGYEHSTLWQGEHRQGFLSLTHPMWGAIWGLSFSPFRGLFFSAPVLLLILGGLWVGLRKTSTVVPTLVVFSGSAALFLAIGSSIMWWGGFAAGPRYLLPGIPLLGILVGFAISWMNRQALRSRVIGLAVVAAMSAASMVLTWSLTFAGQSYPPDTYHNPLREYVLPALEHGNVARNVGNIFQLSGVMSLLPLAIVVSIGMLLIVLQLRPRQPKRSSFGLAITEGSGSPQLEGNR